MTTDLEQKSKRIQTIVSIIALGGACLLIGPLYLTILHGLGALLGLGVGAVGVFVSVNLMPWFALKVANWRLKALKAEAAANPIETLENLEQQKMEALSQRRDNIKQLDCVVQELWGQIEDYQTKYPGKVCQSLDKYNKLKSLLGLRANKYKQAQKNLVVFHNLIEEKRTDWQIAQTAAKASKLANVGEDFQSKLEQDTALTSVQDGLNLAFSELNASLLDEQAAAPDPLDLGLTTPTEEVDAEPVIPTTRSKKQRNVSVS